MPRVSDDAAPPGDPTGAAESVRSSEQAKRLAPETEAWLGRFQQAGVELATDEESRKAIAARLF